MFKIFHNEINESNKCSQQLKVLIICWIDNKKNNNKFNLFLYDWTWLYLLCKQYLTNYYAL